MGLMNRHSYLDTSIDFIISDIIEYDMKSAGFSIIKEYGLLPESTITRLSDITDKGKRNTTIGKIDRSHKELNLLKTVNDYICQYRNRFYDENELEDDDILSIKKDALFIKKYCNILEFPKSEGDSTFIKFEPKNIYSAYMYLDKKEIYYNFKGLDIKGIDDHRLELHKKYMCKFIHEAISILMEYDYDRYKRKLVDFANRYKRRELDPGYYREFNSNCQYSAIVSGSMMLLEDVGDISICDISYNYTHIIVPLLSLVI